jgi:hypothetical protein
MGEPGLCLVAQACKGHLAVSGAQINAPSKRVGTNWCAYPRPIAKEMKAAVAERSKQNGPRGFRGPF